MKRFRNHSGAGPDRLLLWLYRRRIQIVIGLEALAVFFLLAAYITGPARPASRTGIFPGRPSPLSGQETDPAQSGKDDFIKWVDFDVTSDAMTQAFRFDVATCQQEIHLNWVQLLAVLGARYGGDFSRYKPADMETLAKRLQDGETIEAVTKDLKYYPYYLEAYGAVLNGMVGYYEIQIPESEAPAFALAQEQDNAGGESRAQGEEGQGNDAPESGVQKYAPETKEEALTPSGERKIWVTKYGLKAFHPLAKHFPYSHYNDFGVSRSYGYRRQHLGHDMMGQTGTPVIAVESGYVEAIGWNQYGGWRLGIRSFDKKRYYYYAHLRKDYPYQSVLKEGSIVTAGDVIGYLGRTGYSATENTNNIDEPHLHFGLQLIFDESQKEGNNEIWIDCYELIKFLSVNRSESVKVDGTKEWTRIYQMKDPAVAEESR